MAREPRPEDPILAFKKANIKAVQRIVARAHQATVKSSGRGKAKLSFNRGFLAKALDKAMAHHGRTAGQRTSIRKTAPDTGGRPYHFGFTTVTKGQRAPKGQRSTPKATAGAQGGAAAQAKGGTAQANTAAASAGAGKNRAGGRPSGSASRETKAGTSNGGGTGRMRYSANTREGAHQAYTERDGALERDAEPIDLDLLDRLEQRYGDAGLEDDGIGLEQTGRDGIARPTEPDLSDDQDQDPERGQTAALVSGGLENGIQFQDGAEELAGIELRTSAIDRPDQADADRSTEADISTAAATDIESILQVGRSGGIDQDAGVDLDAGPGAGADIETGVTSRSETLATETIASGSLDSALTERDWSLEPETRPETRPDAEIRLDTEARPEESLQLSTDRNTTTEPLRNGSDSETFETVARDTTMGPEADRLLVTSSPSNRVTDQEDDRSGDGSTAGPTIGPTAERPAEQETGPLTEDIARTDLFGRIAINDRPDTDPRTDETTRADDSPGTERAGGSPRVADDRRVDGADSSKATDDDERRGPDISRDPTPDLKTNDTAPNDDTRRTSDEARPAIAPGSDDRDRSEAGTDDVRSTGPSTTRRTETETPHIAGDTPSAAASVIAWIEEERGSRPGLSEGSSEAAAQAYVEDPRKVARVRGTTSSFGTIGDTLEERMAFWDLVHDHESSAGGRTQSRLVLELPHEANGAMRHDIIRRYVSEFEEKGLPYWASIHEPTHKNDSRNHHAHIVFSDRPMAMMDHPQTGERVWDFTVEETWHTKTSGNKRISHPYRQDRDPAMRDRGWVRRDRARFSAIVNDVMVENGLGVRYDPRSYADMGLDVAPMTNVNMILADRSKKQRFVVMDPEWTRRLIDTEMQEAAIRRDDTYQQLRDVEQRIRDGARQSNGPRRANERLPRGMRLSPGHGLVPWIAERIGTKMLELERENLATRFIDEATARTLGHVIEATGSKYSGQREMRTAAGADAPDPAAMAALNEAARAELTAFEKDRAGRTSGLRRAGRAIMETWTGLARGKTARTVGPADDSPGAAHSGISVSRTASSRTNDNNQTADPQTAGPRPGQGDSSVQSTSTDGPIKYRSAAPDPGPNQEAGKGRSRPGTASVAEDRTQAASKAPRRVADMETIGNAMATAAASYLSADDPAGVAAAARSLVSQMAVIAKSAMKQAAEQAGLTGRDETSSRSTGTTAPEPHSTRSTDASQPSRRSATVDNTPAVAAAETQLSLALDKVSPPNNRSVAEPAMKTVQLQATVNKGSPGSRPRTDADAVKPETPTVTDRAPATPARAHKSNDQAMQPSTSPRSEASSPAPGTPPSTGPEPKGIRTMADTSNRAADAVFDPAIGNTTSTGPRDTAKSTTEPTKDPRPPIDSKIPAADAEIDARRKRRRALLAKRGKGPGL